MVVNLRPLFFYNIDDRRISSSLRFKSAIYHDYRFIFLKRLGDAFTGFYFNRIIINNTKIEVCKPYKLPTIQHGEPGPLLFKIMSVLFIPFGIMCKAIFCMFNWKHIKKTNGFIIKKLHQQSKQKQKIVFCQYKNIIQKEKEIRGCKNNLYDKFDKIVLTSNTLPFLTIGDLQSFARASTENYQIVAKSNLAMQYKLKYEKYPLVIPTFLGTKNIDLLDSSYKHTTVLTADLRLIEQSCYYSSYILLGSGIDESEFSRAERVRRNTELTFQENIKFTFQKFSNTKFTVKIKDNFSLTEQVIFLSKDGLTHLYWFLPYHLWLFLNEWDRSPKVFDYITRLRKGEPCGRFPQELNMHIPYDDTRENLANLLQEGPVFMKDGTTPVIQYVHTRFDVLWQEANSLSKHFKS